MEALQKKPLYCFKLNEETGEITRYEIIDYKHFSPPNPRRWYFKFKADLGSGLSWYECKDSNIDRFVSGKVYSYDPNIEHAYDVIYAAITDKIEEAERAERRWKLTHANMWLWQLQQEREKR